MREPPGPEIFAGVNFSRRRGLDLPGGLSKFVVGGRGDPRKFIPCLIWQSGAAGGMNKTLRAFEDDVGAVEGYLPAARECGRWAWDGGSGVL